MLAGEWDKEILLIWSAQGFTYVDIMITPETSQLDKANDGRLFAQIRSELAFLIPGIGPSHARQADFHVHMAEMET